MTAHTTKQCRAWHEITPLRLHPRSNEVGRGMSSPPLDNKHGRTTSGMAFHHHVWAAHTVQRRRAWHAIITFGQHKRSNDVGRCMPSSPLGSTHGLTTSGVACQHCLKAADTVERHRAWHDITAFGQHTRSYNVRRGMPSSPFDGKHSRTTSGVA